MTQSTSSTTSFHTPATSAIFARSGEFDSAKYSEIEAQVRSWMPEAQPWDLIRRYVTFAPDLALEKLEQILERTQDAREAARCYLEAARLREAKQEFGTAATAYAEAIRLGLGDPDAEYDAWNNQGYCLNRIHRPEEALAACGRAIAIHPGRFNAHKNLGIALELLGRTQEAVREYAIATRAEPQDERALRRLRLLVAQEPALAAEVSDLQIPADAHAAPEATRASARRFILSIRVDPPRWVEGLQVFGLRSSLNGGASYVTLDEALASGTFEVTETGKHGTVPTLRVANRGSEPVFMMAGEHLVGAKQNRVLDASILVSAETELPIPVSCVEAGRWASRSRSFASSGTSSHHALRHLMSRHVYEAYKKDGRPSSNQREVWMEVERKLMAHKSRSPSSALSSAYESMEPELERVERSIPADPEWNGALFAYRGAIAGFDLFDRPATLQKLWPKLVRAYGIDALESTDSGEVSHGEAEAWMRELENAAFSAFPSPGLGTDVRIESRRAIGALLMVDGHPLHAEAFAHEEW